MFKRSCEGTFPTTHTKTVPFLLSFRASQPAVVVLLGRSGDTTQRTIDSTGCHFGNAHKNISNFQQKIPVPSSFSFWSAVYSLASRALAGINPPSHSPLSINGFWEAVSFYGNCYGTNQAASSKHQPPQHSNA